ncbi:DUF4132 domain-containing protein [Shigella flexneri]
MACFRVAEDDGSGTADDDLFACRKAISLLVFLTFWKSHNRSARLWAAFCRLQLLPPFRQLDRNSYALTEAEERNASELTRWAGRKCRVVG